MTVTFAETLKKNAGQEQAEDRTLLDRQTAERTPKKIEWKTAEMTVSLQKQTDVLIDAVVDMIFSWYGQKIVF